MILYEAFTMLKKSPPPPSIFRACLPVSCLLMAVTEDGMAEGFGAGAQKAWPAAGIAGVRPARAPVWKAECRAFRHYDEIATLVEGLEGSSFQSRHWLSAWLETFPAEGKIEPFLAFFRDETGEVVLALPLIRRRAHGLRLIECADCHVSDYDAPLLRRKAMADCPPAARLYPALIEALPPADLLRFTRLSPEAGDMVNPLHGHGWAVTDPVSGWVLDLAGSWQARRERVSDSQRVRLDKIRRKVERTEGFRFVVIEDVETAIAAIDALTAMQAARSRETGQGYHLDRPIYDAFYKRLARRGIPTGETLICGILSERDGWIALNFSVRSGEEIVYLRLGNRYGEWAKLSPGIALTEFTVEQAHQRGLRVFDFGMGNYDYKRRLGGRERKLQNLVLPLSPRGLPYSLYWHARARLRQVGWLRRLLGRPPHQSSLPG
jgi:CelD/BcsL family acetyltransferase involved in cellulose biosynthesis